MAAFLANVGVNTSHAARSPLFTDGTFRLVPIPEAHRWRQPMLRFADLPHLRPHAPARWSGRAAHLDPDLAASPPTYGDNCRRAARAFSLRRAATGDLLVFLARLQPVDSPAALFFVVGCLEIDAVIADITSDPGPGWWDANAHVRRARATSRWDSFWVFGGGPRSRLLERAIPFGRDQAAHVFGDTWRWRPHRTELQTIGSYTRTVRRVDGPGEEWLRTICRS